MQAYWAYSPSYPVICVSGMFIIVFASLMTATNFIVLVLPIFIVWKLQLPTRQRLIVTVLLSLSLFACIAGLIRDILIVHALRSYDASWSAWAFDFAGVIEVDLGVVSFLADRFFLVSSPWDMADTSAFYSRSAPPLLRSGPLSHITSPACALRLQRSNLSRILILPCFRSNQRTASWLFWSIIAGRLCRR